MVKLMPEPTDRQLRNLWAKIDEGGPDECWPWTACKTRDGYGQFGLNKRLYLAHRIIYKLAKGEPGNLCVCHSCDTPSCCNPAHLFIGTAADNMHDMVVKGRSAGEKHGTAILTEKQVLEIRDSDATGRELALKYGVHQGTVAHARTGTSWTHIPGRGKRRRLRPEQVREIRELHKRGATGRELAKQFERTGGLISLVVNRKVWKNA